MTMPLMRPPRKNPVQRTRQMNVPPWARGRVALSLTAAAAEGRFELQVCRDCGGKSIAGITAAADWAQQWATCSRLCKADGMSFSAGTSISASAWSE